MEEKTNDILDMAPTEVLSMLIKDTEIAQVIELPKASYKVYTLDENTADLVFDIVNAHGYRNTVLAFRMYYASRTTPKGFIKFITTGLFTRWVKWVVEIRGRKAHYGDKWYEGMTDLYITNLRNEMTCDLVYSNITSPIRTEALEKGITSEVELLEAVKAKFHNSAMEYINKQFESSISDLLLLFPECPDHYINMSPEFKHLNTQTFTFIQEIKEEALKYYAYKELS